MPRGLQPLGLSLYLNPPEGGDTHQKGDEQWILIRLSVCLVDRDFHCWLLCRPHGRRHLGLDAKSRMRRGLHCGRAQPADLHGRRIGHGDLVCRRDVDGGVFDRLPVRLPGRDF